MNTAQQTDGWITWTGGERFEPPALVEVRQRSGKTDRSFSTYFDWEHRDSRGDIVAYRIVPPTTKLVEQDSALGVQEGGSHYKNKPIQPVEYITANKLNFLEGCIVKRITRWRDKQSGGDRFVDLRKIKHEVDLLIEMEQKFGDEGAVR